VKLRESGMPDEAYWESLFDIETILNRLGIDASIKDLVELGCGYGTFTLPVARRIAGVVTTTDIEPDMVTKTAIRASDAGLANVVCRTADVLRDGFGVPSESQDACLLFNILHCEEPVRLLIEGAKTVRQGGAVLVIHWRYDPATPRGPSMAIRPKPEDIIAWAEGTRLLQRTGDVIDLPPWHYGIRFLKRIGANAPD
jgi:SAM-dependent methyltransferase